MATVAILPVVALVLVYLAIGRYRADVRAKLAGVAAGLAGAGGVALALPEVNGRVPLWAVFVLGAAAIAVAVLGSVYAEQRLKRARL